MRLPLEDIDASVDVILSNGNQFQGGGRPGNQTQSGSAVMIRIAGDSAWRPLPMQFQTTVGNDKNPCSTVRIKIPREYSGPARSVIPLRMITTAIPSVQFWSRISSHRTGLRISMCKRSLTSRGIVTQHLKFSVEGTRRSLTLKRDGSKSRRPKRSGANAALLPLVHEGSAVSGRRKYGTKARWSGQA